MANNKDFIVNNLVEVGGSMKATVGSSSSTGDVSIGFYSVESGSYDNVTFEIEGSVPLAMAFGDNGTKMYISTNGQDRVFQYSLSTAYDISTASYASVQDNFLVTNATQGIAFSPDGTKMYTCDTQSDIVIQYSLSTAYNVSTASYNNVSFYFGNEQDQGKTVRFNDDGTKMFLGGWYAPGAATPYGKIHQYSLSTAYDISTASYDSIIFDVGTEVGYSYQLDDFVFNDDGSKLVAINSAPTSPTILTYFVTQYSTEKIVPSITLDTSTGNYFTQTLSSNIAFLFSNLSGVQTFQVEVTNSSSSDYEIAWPSSVRLSNGNALPSPGPGEKYIYTIVANDFGGTNYFVTVNTGP